MARAAMPAVAETACWAGLSEREAQHQGLPPGIGPEQTTSAEVLSLQAKTLPNAAAVSHCGWGSFRPRAA